METQRNADDGISAESVNEKAKQGGQGKEKLSSCFCCGGDTGKSGSIRPLLIADADQIIQTDLIPVSYTHLDVYKRQNIYFGAGKTVAGSIEGDTDPYADGLCLVNGA